MAATHPVATGAGFLTQDTRKGDPWQPWTQNLYTYVGNNPVNYVDPTGHWAITVGVSRMAALFFGTKGEVAFGIDSHGNIGFITTEQVVSPGFGYGAGPTVGLWWGVDTLDDMAGGGGSIGASLGYGLEAEFGADGKLIGAEFSLGGNGGWTGSLYAAGGGTQVASLSVPKFLKWFVNQVKPEKSKDATQFSSIREYFKHVYGADPDPAWDDDTLRDLLIKTGHKVPHNLSSAPADNSKCVGGALY